MSRILVGLIACALWSCNPAEKPLVSKAYSAHCGSCHVAPAIDQLPKRFWAEDVLPDMAARVGIKTSGYDPMQGMTFEERKAVLQSGIYPVRPQIPEALWQDISAYIQKMAPDSIVSLPELPLALLPHYRKIPLAHPNMALPSITYLNLEGGKIEIGDLQGDIWSYDTKMQQWDKTHSFESPVTSVIRKDSIIWALTVGILNPSEQSRGRLYKVESKDVQLLIDSLHRPVHISTMPGGTDSRFLISEFGHLTGRLSQCSNSGTIAEVITLIDSPGALRSVQADIDKDGNPEWLVLFAQGDERLIALKPGANGDYQVKQLLRFSPISGVSWFEVSDVDLDGDLDIITVHGDNADHTYLHKPYHGVRIHTNDGKGNYELAFTYPMYGATRVAVLDWDRDNDPDLAVISAFPNYDQGEAVSFLVLENTAPQDLKFVGRTFEDHNSGRWFLMDAGDLDGDGDADLVLSVFNYHITPVADKHLERWEKETTALMILENTLFD